MKEVYCYDLVLVSEPICLLHAILPSSLWLGHSMHLASYKIPTYHPLLLFISLCQSVYLLEKCQSWYLLTGYPQIPALQCTYSYFSYGLLKCLLLYSFTSHVQAHSWQGTCSDTTVISQILIFYCFTIIGHFGGYKITKVNLHARCRANGPKL